MRALFALMTLVCLTGAGRADDYYYPPGMMPPAVAPPVPQPMDSEVAALKARIEALERKLAKTDDRVEVVEKRAMVQDDKLDAILKAVTEKSAPVIVPKLESVPLLKAAPVELDHKREKLTLYVPDIPEGATQFSGTKHTQAIDVLMNTANAGPRILKFPIEKMSDKRWQQPGGMEGIKGWKVAKYGYIPEGKNVLTWIGNIDVFNGKNFQQNLGIKREYPIGTRFDEVLSNADTGKVFEHRTREKTSTDGFAKWVSRVEYADPESRPAGYSGLKVSCSSCHAEAGTGKYSDGLVPGGDTILSDSLDWSLVSNGVTASRPRR